MSLLTRARATKAIDQVAQYGEGYGGRYIPLYDRQSWTGYGISPEFAQNIITVYQCVRILAETFAQVPLMLYRRSADGAKERASDHPLYRTLHDEPNPDMSSFVYRELVMTHLATWGNSYSEITEDGFGGKSLWPIRPDRIEVRWGPTGEREYYYLSPLGGRKLMAPGTIFHVPGMSSNGLVGQSPIAVMRNALSLYATAERHGQSFFSNGARPATVLKHPKTLSTGAIDRLSAQMESLRGSGNAGKTVVLEEGLDFGEVGVTPEDAQFLETRLFQKRELAGGFRMRGSMLNDPDDGQSEEDESRRLIKQTMVPWFERFEAEAQRQLLSISDQDEYFVEFLPDGYLRGDPKARADAFAVQWEHGNLSNDEWRRAENLDPLPDGLGEKYYRPANWVEVGQPNTTAVGGDASVPTQFGGDARIPEQLTRAKAEFRCPECGRLLVRGAYPGTVADCSKCKVERVMDEAVG